jgi:hypothetical protein
MALSTLRFVGVLFASGGSTLKVNTSLSGSHKTPRVLVFDGSSLLISQQITGHSRGCLRQLMACSRTISAAENLPDPTGQITDVADPGHSL